jgi:hypothetical protein
MISYGEHSLAAGPRQCYFWVTPAFWSPYLLVLLLMGTATYGYCYLWVLLLMGTATFWPPLLLVIPRLR